MLRLMVGVCGEGDATLQLEHMSGFHQNENALKTN